MIYVVQVAPCGPVKIGFTAEGGNPPARIRELQTMCPFPLVLRELREGTLQDERALHLRFQPFRIHGEWFQPDWFVAEMFPSVVPGGVRLRGDVPMSAADAFRAGAEAALQGARQHLEGVSAGRLVEDSEWARGEFAAEFLKAPVDWWRRDEDGKVVR